MTTNFQYTQSLWKKIPKPQQIDEHFRTIHSDHLKDLPSYDEYLSKHLFFITVNFEANGVTAHGVIRRNRDNELVECPSAIKAFGILNCRIARALVGNNIETKRKHQPLTYAFTDFKGSTLQTKLFVATRTMPHIHGLMLVPPQYVENFSKLPLSSYLFSPDPMNEVYVKPFDASKSSVEDLASYCMKGTVRSVDDPKREDLWGFFPK